MKNLLKLVFIAVVLILFGCGKGQSGQESPAKATTMEKPAVTAAPAAPAAASKESSMEKMEKPAWARLEQNVYHYPQ